MKTVFDNATKIYSELFPKDKALGEPRFLVVATVAWLHDVADHKYIKKDPSLMTSLNEFLERYTVEHAHVMAGTQYEAVFTPKGVLAITERISFSREKKQGDKDWQEAMGAAGIEIRNIVSDADKMDAIGRKVTSILPLFLSIHSSIQ